MRPTRRTLRSFLTLFLASATINACGDDDPVGPDPLAAPATLTVQSVSSTEIVLVWSAVPGATSYEVDRSTGTGGSFTTIAGSVTGTSLSDAGLAAGTQYSYRVRAARSSDRGPYSDVESATTGAAGPKTANLTGDITASRTLYSDTTYTLVGFVKVTSGATLTIQPGTRIVGDYDTPGSSLFVLRGARIVAEGTAAAPIVFTSERAVGERRPGDWGGLVIIGNGIINRAGTVLSEGPAGVSQNYSGGTDNNDSSGSLEYVRVEFAGYDVSGGQGQELNSISMYAVGGGTTMEHVQTLAGLDDAFEWWGGAVDARYLVSYETGDDHYDASEGFRGRVQHLIALGTTVLSTDPARGEPSSDPRGFEIDGCDGGSTSGCTLGFASEPYTVPVFANYTIIGPGVDGFGASITDGNGTVIRRGAGGTWVNGIVARWPGYGLSVRDAETDALRAVDSLIIRNMIFAENGRGAFEPNSSGRFASSFDVPANSIRTLADAEPLFIALPVPGTAPTTGSLDWAPAAGSAAASGGLTDFTPVIAARVQDYFGAPMPATDYVGAADPDGPKWWAGWTVYARN
ncbi:MAG: fibronectin type III domain-containing protein [Gemmatimonadaceae bacterium]